jgi:hypothetical protein
MKSTASEEIVLVKAGKSHARAGRKKLDRLQEEKSISIQTDIRYIISCRL